MKKIISLLTGLMIDLGNIQLSSAEDIRDVKPPIAFPSNYLVWIIPLLILAVFLISWLMWRFIKGKSLERRYHEPPQSPWEVAYERLRQLKSKHLPAQGQIKEYYSLLSDIVRHYIEDRFVIRAPEMTTEEFLWSLKASDKLTAEQKEAIQRFLICCDMVKFARYGSNAQEMEKSFILAERLVDETKQEAKGVEK